MRYIISAVLPFLFLATTTFATEEKVKIPAGTPVEVQVLERVTSSVNKQGDRVIMAVNNDVKVDGRLVIAKGAPVFAEIAEIAPPKMGGRAGMIRFTFRTVRTVDEQSIPLSGSRGREGDDKTVETLAAAYVCCPLIALKKGDEAVVEPNSVFTTYVLQDSIVRTNQ